MRIPVWLTLGFAAFVIVFGSYRIRLALKPRPPADDAAPPASGMARISQRTHLFVGVIYLLLGAMLIATSFGFNPLGNAFGPSTDTPPKDQAPTKGGLPIDTVPAPKK